MRKQQGLSQQQAAAELKLRVDYPDEDLRRRISSFLGSRHFPAFRRLEVKVAAGAVTLRGHVGSYYEKQVALDTCRRVAGVLCTIDQVDVDAGIAGPETHPDLVGQVRAGCVEPGGCGSQIEFPAHAGLGAF
jgi:osmotically-inducible protein OsmY